MTVVRSPIKWYGGKSWLVNYVLTRIPEECNVFIECFGGGAWITINTPENMFMTRICNDINGVLVNFWMTLRDHHERLISDSSYLVDSEAVFRDMMEKLHATPSTVDEQVDQAVAFFYVNTHSFSGLNVSYHGLPFKTCAQHQRAYMSKLQLFEDVWSRVRDVIFMNRNVFDLLHDADRPGVFLYVDPPYFNGGFHYEDIPGGHAWTMDDHVNLRELLWSMEHAKIMISIDDDKFYKKDGWFVDTVEKRIVLRCDASVGDEYVITNYTPRERKFVHCADSFSF